MNNKPKTFKILALLVLLFSFDTGFSREISSKDIRKVVDLYYKIRNSTGL